MGAASTFATGGLSAARGARSVGGLGSAAGGVLGSYRHGGRWDKDLGGWVIVGEDGEELLVADDGTTRRLGVDGPELTKADRPGIVVPAPLLR